MDLGIRDKVALVSGGSRGIGRAAADIFAEEGCRVVIAGRSPDALNSAVDSLKSAGAQVAGVVADMTDKADIQRAVAFTRDTFDMPDIVVSNVHIGQGGGDGEGTFDTLTDEDYLAAFNDFTLSVIRLTREVVPAMKAKRWGRLINIGSCAAREPPRALEHLLHNVARAPVVLLNKTLANELGAFGITVNTIGTGWIATEAVEKFARDLNIGEDNMVRWVQENIGIPVGRFGKPREEGALIAFLASEYGGFLTGNWIPFDGGEHRSAW